MLYTDKDKSFFIILFKNLFVYSNKMQNFGKKKVERLCKFHNHFF